MKLENAPAPKGESLKVGDILETKKEYSYWLTRTAFIDRSDMGKSFIIGNKKNPLIYLSMEKARLTYSWGEVCDRVCLRVLNLENQEVNFIQEIRYHKDEDVINEKEKSGYVYLWPSKIYKPGKFPKNAFECSAYFGNFFRKINT